MEILRAIRRQSQGDERFVPFSLKPTTRTSSTTPKSPTRVNPSKKTVTHPVSNTQDLFPLSKKNKIHQPQGPQSPPYILTRPPHPV